MKLRAYEYKCRRCGVIFDDNASYPSDMVERHISVIAIPDPDEGEWLEKDYPNHYLGDSQLKSCHECKDGGYGLGDLIGCSKEYELTGEP